MMQCEGTNGQQQNILPSDQQRYRILAVHIGDLKRIPILLSILIEYLNNIMNFLPKDEKY